MYVCMHVRMYVWRKATGSFSYLAWSSSQRALPERGFGGEGLSVWPSAPLFLVFEKTWKSVCFLVFGVHWRLVVNKSNSKIINISLDVSSTWKLMDFVFSSPMAVEFAKSAPNITNPGSKWTCASRCSHSSKMIGVVEISPVRSCVFQTTFFDFL